MAIKVLARANGTAEVSIDGPIGQDWYGDGITAKRFRADLTALGDVSEILVRINSPGGEVFDGFSIYNALKEHKAKVRVHIDGLAASIASVIAMAGDEIQMGVGAMFMVHSPWTIAMGDADNMRATADMLDKVSVGLVDAYVARTSQSRKTVEGWMDGETWFTRDEAVAAGLADAPAEESQTDPAPAAVWQMLKQSASASFRAFAMTRVSNPPQETAVSPTTAAAAAIQETMMTPEEQAALAAKKASEEAVQAALRAESDRQAQIRAAFEPFAEHRELLDTCLADQKCTVEAARSQLLAKLGKDVTPSGARSTVTVDSRDKFIAGVSNAILSRRGVEKADPQNEWNGARLSRIARAVLQRAGVPHVDRLEGATLASKVFATMTSSDFPLLLANTANKALRASYDLQPTTWRTWAKKGEVSDFKSNSRIQQGTFNSLSTIPEGGEYKYGDVTEEAESIQAVTKGRAISLTRQMLVNDDLGAFVDRAQRVGFAAARTVNEDVYARLQASTAMSDTGALFNATAVSTAGGHANLTSSGTAISVASISVGEAMMAVQKDKALRTTLNITPRFLLVPRAKKQLGWEVLNSSADPAQSNPNKRNYAANLGLDLVSDALLDATSGTAWYLLADPNLVPVIEVDFLDGVDTPYTDEMVDFFTDAMVMKVRLDYGVQAIDWRGGYKNVGA